MAPNTQDYHVHYQTNGDGQITELEARIFAEQADKQL
jgi:hypothetical protein